MSPLRPKSSHLAEGALGGPALGPGGTVVMVFGLAIEFWDLELGCLSCSWFTISIIYVSQFLIGPGLADFVFVLFRMRPRTLKFFAAQSGSDVWFRLLPF